MPGALNLRGEAERTARVLENRGYVRWLLLREESPAAYWLRRHDPDTLDQLQAAAADQYVRAAV
jgi:hypothetical protein